MDTAKLKRCQIYLTTQQLAELKKLKTQKGLPMSETIRRSIDEYFDRILPERNHNEN